ncbi:ANTAR domain-containing protein [Amycolatopsis sp. lyj-23]|uniref:ANTAR domain-containing protein n=1 Tax=Amycolatopsis sp. lyj-23 TaxID=2789283 RepID=UPI003979ECC1
MWSAPEDPGSEVEQLRAALVTQPVIEQAKGMIMVLRSCSAEAAFALLREVSQHINLKLHQVAEVLVATGSHTPAADPERSAIVLAELRRRGLGEVSG